MSLTRWGHEVVEAVDGTEALSIMEECPEIPFAIIDWSMPGVQGIDVCRQLREKKSDVYILLVTGKGNDHDVSAGLEAGANDYLTKPFAQDVLRLRVLVGIRFVEMRSSLVEKVHQLEGGIAERREVDTLLRSMMEIHDGVSDLLFAVGKFPQVEVYGKLQPVKIPHWDQMLTAGRIKQLCDYLMEGQPRLHVDYDERGSCDCSYAVEEFARLRVNIFKRNGEPAIVMRKLQSEVPSLDKLGLPPIFRDIIREKNGIVFVTGGTGSGKTTTLAAMLNELNQTSEIHIVSLEDPIEFVQSPNGKATFSQRQLGRGFHRLRWRTPRGPQAGSQSDPRGRNS